jgi:predicted cupin superfamily sugar epimerase
MKQDADYWIQKLNLVKHEEGGWYTLVYRSPFLLPQQILPNTFLGSRPAATAIYFLLAKDNFSALHRIASDELWHFYTGDTLLVYEIKPDEQLIEHRLGSNFEAGEQFQCAVTAGSWFGAKLQDGGQFALVGCTVSPGFDYAEFELAKREMLEKQFPQHQAIIALLTRK